MLKTLLKKLKIGCFKGNSALRSEKVLPDFYRQSLTIWYSKNVQKLISFYGVFLYVGFRYKQ